MASSVKDLHLCKCLEDLQRQAKPTKLEYISAKKIITSAEKIYTEAERAASGGDEELAYCYYYRFLEAISIAQKKDDYKKEKAYFDKLISKNKFIRALESLEALTNSLERRYKLKKDAEDLESHAKSKEYNEALENEKNLKNRKGGGGEIPSSGESLKASISTFNGVVKTNGVDKVVSVENTGIKPCELKNLLEQKSKRMLLVDCRDQHDFSNNHIKHSNCICIPPTALTQGMSANAIQNALKEQNPESYMDWHKRGGFDYIILYDWNSTFEHRLPALNIVYDALTKWDQDTRNTKVLVVQGGMKNMYYVYPILLTNPQSGVNSVNKVNGSAIEFGDLKKLELESISYPNLDDNLDITKSQSSEPKENIVNNNTAGVPIKVDSSNNTNDKQFTNNSTHVHDVPKSSGLLPIDRSTKPTRYSAGQKISNGTGNELMATDVNYPAVVTSSVAKTDSKVQEYSQALDDVIQSAKDAFNKEKELNDLTERVSKLHHDDDDQTKNKLKEKELEAEKLRILLEKRNIEVAQLKAQCLEMLREQKSKQHLPRIRTPPEEEEMAAKEVEKQKLDEMVNELRRVRKEDEERRKIAEQEKKASENVSRFPPISQTNASDAVHGSNGTGAVQLPIINNSLPSVTPNSGTTLKPASGNTSSTSASSRPVSQDSSGVTRIKLKDESSEPPRSSALKRSHSHPNIAQSHDEDTNNDALTSSQIPRINRNLKPGTRFETITTPSRRFARNFEVVSSTERSKTGLKNLGNTCYMNSVIQCLAHTNKLVDYLRKEEYSKDWHPSRSPTKGEATEELAAAVKQMHSGHRSISLLDLKTTVGRHHRSFRGSEQQDSHEFITIMLDWLHEELNRVEKTPLKEQKNDGLTDEVAASRAWEDYRRSNDSKISELFCGQQKSCVTCTSCSKQSVTFEPFFILSVPIPSNGRRCDIQQCIDFYTTVEDLVGWNCVSCKKKVRATKKIDLWKLPPYLIIHLQRFYFDGYWKKRLTEVDFPVENLNLNPKVLGRQSSQTSYDFQLYGVSNHYGSMDGGHYTAYCRQLGPGNWCKFDDQEVCPIRDVSTPAAYILFYQNRNY